jgi:hypothetical protein
MMALAAFSGCATLSKNECLEADWYELGWRDGSSGKPRSLFQDHVESCMQHNVKPDRGAYYRGRDEGLKIYCTYDSGFKQGRRGRSFHHVCPPELEPTFWAGYKKGSEIRKYEEKIAALEKNLKKIERQIEEKEKELISQTLSYEQRTLIRVDIRKLDLKYRDLARELKQLRETEPLL